MVLSLEAWAKVAVAMWVTPQIATNNTQSAPNLALIFRLSLGTHAHLCKLLQGGTRKTSGTLRCTILPNASVAR